MTIQKAIQNRISGALRRSRDTLSNVGRWRQSRVSIFHEFHRPPYGGGNQFLLALRGALEDMDIPVLINQVSARTQALLFNSYNFDFDQLLKLRERYPHIRFIHRVDGPISLYRGSDPESVALDQKIFEINSRLANFTIFQSRYSLEASRVLGFTVSSVDVIPNAPDPGIFFPSVPREVLPGQKIRIIATAWSNHAKKGQATFDYLDHHLPDTMEFTFIGRLARPLKNIRVLPPLPSRELAQFLRTQDLYLAASQDDPCSNALIEALSSGLPAVYLRSGGHPELVGTAGIGYETPSGLVEILKEMTPEKIRDYQKELSPPVLQSVAARYIKAFQLSH